MADLLRSYGDKIVLGVLSFLTPIILGLIGWRKLKALGVNRYNIAEIADRATFRKELMDRVKHVENQLGESQRRVAGLSRENGEQAAQIEAMEQDIRELKSERRGLKNEVRDLRRQLRDLTTERDQFKAKLS